MEALTLPSMLHLEFTLLETVVTAGRPMTVGVGLGRILVVDPESKIVCVVRCIQLASTIITRDSLVAIVKEVELTMLKRGPTTPQNPIHL